MCHHGTVCSTHVVWLPSQVFLAIVVRKLIIHSLSGRHGWVVKFIWIVEWATPWVNIASGRGYTTFHGEVDQKLKFFANVWVPVGEISDAEMGLLPALFLRHPSISYAQLLCSVFSRHFFSLSRICFVWLLVALWLTYLAAFCCCVCASVVVGIHLLCS